MKGLIKFMQGLELSEKYYEEYGKKMLAEKFAYLKFAAGAVGNGSEFFGFDDEVSRDHDYRAGFCLWLTAADEAQSGFALEREYAALPKDFCGITPSEKSTYSEKKYGVFEIGDFYSKIIGIAEPNTLQEWFYIPEYALAAATCGKVFCDGRGEFSRIRNKLMNEMPKDIRLKKLAAHLTYMAQSGQYNFERCIKHGEAAAARLALSEFVDHAVSVIFWFNQKYAPFYKWKFRAMRNLPLLSQTAKDAEQLLLLPCDPEGLKKCTATIEKICVDIAAELCERGLSSSKSTYLENHAMSVRDKIQNRQLRSLHIMEYGG